MKESRKVLAAIFSVIDVLMRYREIKGSILAVLCVAAFGAASAAEWDFSKVSIVAPTRAVRLQKVAVDELKYHLKLVAGTKFGNDAPFRFVFAKPEDAPESKDFESRYRIDGQTVWFWGDDGGPDEIWDWGDNRGKEDMKRSGSLFAVSLFLENELSIRWLWPGEGGISYRLMRTVALPDRAERSFVTKMIKSRIRNYYQYGTHKYLTYAMMAPKELRGMMGVESDDLKGDWEARWLWLRRNRLQDRDFFQYGHAFTDWKTRFQLSHPDYLNYTCATDDRGNTGREGPERTKFCVSNEAVVDQIIADWFAAGTNRYINVCENDSAHWCECAACRALDVPKAGERPLAHLTDRYVNFWNRIARKARACRADVTLVSYIYSAYRLPPRRERLEFPDNMLFGIVPSILDDVVEDMVKPWCAAGMRKFFLRPNHLHFIGTIPRGMERHIYDEFQKCRALGMVGVDFDANIDRPAIAIEYYTVAGMLADPEKPFDAIMDEYYSGFGSAKDEVRRYFEAVRESGETARTKLIADGFAVKGKVTDDSELPVQAYGRTEADLAEKAAILKDAIARHADEKCPLARRRLVDLSIQAEQAVKVFRLFAAKHLGKEELARRGRELTDFRIAHRSSLPDDYAAIYGGGSATECECWKKLWPRYACEIDLVTARIEVENPKNPTQKLAAAELERHLKLVAGERRPANDGYLFVIGRKPLCGKDVSAWMSFAQSTDGAMYFWGDDTQLSEEDAHAGSLFGVYGFLEQLVGVVSTKPGDDGILFQSKTKVGIPPGWGYRFCSSPDRGTLRTKGELSRANENNRD